MAMIELTDMELDQVAGGFKGGTPANGSGFNGVADNNHFSGELGASGNLKASAGPGYFIAKLEGRSVSEAVLEALKS